MKRVTSMIGMFCVLVVASCGSDPRPDRGAGGNGALSLSVKSPDSFDPHTTHGKVVKYAVTVTGPGFSAPISAEFPGDATEGLIENVPTGGGREISVVAVNPNGSTILAGEANGVTIGEGITDAEVGLERVPIFANISDGSVTLNTRLVLDVFADPGRAVVIDDSSDENTFSIVDASSSASEIFSNESTWLASVSPKVLPIGPHTLTVRDKENGRSSTVTIKLLDGSLMRPAPIAAATSSSNVASSVVAAVERGLQMEVER